MSRIDPRLPWGIRRVFRLPGNRDRMLRDPDDEMQTHLTLRIEYLRARGMSEKDAEAEREVACVHTFTLIALLVAAAAIVAPYVPARRALRIDPTEALRAD